ncbi:hypothetical protein As57867_004104, partial [Aphanomyces stellatus]
MVKVAVSPHPRLVSVLPPPPRQSTDSNLFESTRMVSTRRDSLSVNASSSLPRAPSATTLKLARRSGPLKAPPRNTWRRRARHMIKYSRASYAGLIYLYSILAAIIGHLILMVMETMDGPANGGSDPAYPYLPSTEAYAMWDMVFAVIFGADLVFQCVIARTQRKFWTRPVTWINILALVPSVGSVVMRDGLHYSTAKRKPINRYVTLLELFRTTRVLFMLRNVDGIKVLRMTVINCLAPLLITLFFLVTLVMLFATMLFYAVPCYSSSSLCPITDIFNAGYFVMVTVSTVGYGDQVVSTDDGVAILITTGAMIFGSLYLAMPLAIIGMTYETT